MNENIEKSLQNAIAREDINEIYRLMHAFSEPMDEAGRIYGESLWRWVRDIDSLRVMIKWLDYIKSPSGFPPKRKWKDLTVRQIVDIFKASFFEMYGDTFRKECEDLCRLILENKKKRIALVHHFNNEVEEMDADYKEGYYEDVPMERHVQNVLAVAKKHRIDPPEPSWLMSAILMRVSLDFVACRKQRQHNQSSPTLTDKP